MKKYIKPEIIIADVELTTNLLGASRVSDGGSLGQEYYSEDVSYSKEDDWDELWDE